MKPNGKCQTTHNSQLSMQIGTRTRGEAHHERPQRVGHSCLSYPHHPGGKKTPRLQPRTPQCPGVASTALPPGEVSPGPEPRRGLQGPLQLVKGATWDQGCIREATESKCWNLLFCRKKGEKQPSDSSFLPGGIGPSLQAPTQHQLRTLVLP